MLLINHLHNKDFLDITEMCQYYKDLVSDEIKFKIIYGVISQPIVVHNSPEDFGITREEANKIRLRFFKTNYLSFKKEEKYYADEILKTSENTRGLLIILWSDINKQLLEAKKKYYFFNKVVKNKLEINNYDLSLIKKIPLNKITEIMPNGFFRTNPFRNEKSPSNSLYWYKRSNRFHDFATGQKGDVIDLYMCITKCDMPTALKELSNIS